MSGHVQPRGKGVWRIFIDDGRDPLSGRRRRVTRTFHGTRKEAEREAETLVARVREGGHGAAAATFGGLLDAWLAHAEPNLAPWTIRGYRSKIETHIRPALGDVKLPKLTTARLDTFYRALRDRGGHRVETSNDGTKRTVAAPLSAQTVRHVHAIIHRACEQARRWGWLDRNPAELAEPPTIEPTERQLPEAEELLKVLAKLTVDMRDLVWVAIISGARRGELCGIRWGDLELDLEADAEGRPTGHLLIGRAIADPKEGIVVKTTKTRKPRPLALDGITIGMLGRRLIRQREKALACGLTIDPALAYVFADEPGAVEPLRPMLVTKRWANAAKTAGVKCRFHDLRHFSITELLEAGFEVGGISKRVGHASAKMTHDVYGHSRRAGDLAAAQHLAALLDSAAIAT